MQRDAKMKAEVLLDHTAWLSVLLGFLNDVFLLKTSLFRNVR